MGVNSRRGAAGVWCEPEGYGSRTIFAGAPLCSASASTVTAATLIAALVDQLRD